METITYHHYALTFPAHEVAGRLADVCLVLIAGCPSRAEAQANYLADRLFNGADAPAHQVEALTKAKSRFTLFKIGPVLVSDHGIGAASMSVAVHELFIMCREAGILKTITMIRFGTCGGIGIEPGTICITNKAFDPLLQDFVELKICCRVVKRPSKMDDDTIRLIQDLATKQPNHDELGYYEVLVGATVASNDFYEEQGRTNGAICHHTPQDKMRFLESIQNAGVINVEMEGLHLASMCHELGVSFGVVCVSLANRFKDDHIPLSETDKALFESRLFWVNLLLARHKLNSK